MSHSPSLRQSEPKITLSLVAARPVHVEGFYDSVAGKLSIGFIAAVSLYLLGWSNWAPAAVTITAVGLFPNYKRTIIASASLAYILFFFSFDLQAGAPGLLRTLSEASAGASFWMNHMVSVGLALGFIGVATWVLVDRAAVRRPVLCFTLFQLFLVIGFSIVPRENSFWILGADLVVVLSSFYGVACYFLRERPYFKEQSNLRQISAIFPIWLTSYVPFRGQLEARDREVETTEQLTECQLSGVKLILWSGFLYGAGLTLRSLFFKVHHAPLSSLEGSSLGWLRPRATGLESFMLLHPGRAAYWIGLYGQTLEFICFERLVPYGIGVGIARCCGIQLFRYVYRPIESRSFNDFLGRMMYFYNAFIVDIFFAPAYLRLRRIEKYKNLRLFCAILFAVTVGGCVIHFFRDAYELIRLGPVAGIKEFFSEQFPYFLALGLVSAFSAILGVRFQPKNLWLKKIGQFVFFLVLFTVYAVVLELHFDYHYSSIADRLRFIHNLFL